MNSNGIEFQNTYGLLICHKCFLHTQRIHSGGRGYCFIAGETKSSNHHKPYRHKGFRVFGYQVVTYGNHHKAYSN